MMPRNIFCCLTIALLCIGCGKAPSPAKQAEQGISKAAEGIEQAKRSVSAMQSQSDALQEKIKLQIVAVNALLERRVALLTQRVNEAHEQLVRLQAEKETTLEPEVTAIKQELANVETQLKSYRDGPAESLKDRETALDDSLRKLDEGLKKLDDDIRAAALPKP